MELPEIIIQPLGDSAATIDLGRSLDRAINDLAISIASKLDDHPFHGFVEASIGMASVTCFYDPIVVRLRYPEFQTAFQFVRSRLIELIEDAEVGSTPSRNLVVPFRVSSELSPDLDHVAEFSGISSDEVLNLFTEREYRVYMLGFLPGFVYMGEVADQIAVPRLTKPRLEVPAGSVAIAGKQAGIYPVASSGGWNSIGRTDIRLFDLERNDPMFFRAGDTVRFELA